MQRYRSYWVDIECLVIFMFLHKYWPNGVVIDHCCIQTINYWHLNASGVQISNTLLQLVNVMFNGLFKLYAINCIWHKQELNILWNYCLFLWAFVNWTSFQSIVEHLCCYEWEMLAMNFVFSKTVRPVDRRWLPKPFCGLHITTESLY